MPAHITLLYPFKPATALTSADHQMLAALFAGYALFAFALDTICRFSGVLQLPPSPPAPFAAMTDAVATAFLEYLPYGGRFATLVPHLTVAELPAHELETVAVEFETAATGGFPIEACVTEAWLYVRNSARWEPELSYPLSR